MGRCCPTLADSAALYRAAITATAAYAHDHRWTRGCAASHRTTPREAPRASCCGSPGRTRGSCRGEVGAGRRGAGAQVGLPDVYHAAACTCARRLCALAHGSNYPMAATEAAPTTACHQHQGRRATCGNTGANSWADQRQQQRQHQHQQAHVCPRARRMRRSASRSCINSSNCCCSQRVEGRRRKLRAQQGGAGCGGAGSYWG